MFIVQGLSGYRKVFGFSSRYNGKLPKGFKKGVMESDLHCRKVTLTAVWREIRVETGGYRCSLGDLDYISV